MGIIEYFIMQIREIRNGINEIIPGDGSIAKT